MGYLEINTIKDRGNVQNVDHKDKTSERRGVVNRPLEEYCIMNEVKLTPVQSIPGGCYRWSLRFMDSSKAFDEYLTDIAEI